jgi:hypothetical protein
MVLIQHAAWDGGQHGWANHIQWIFASAWLRRLRLEACPATRRRHNSAWASARRLSGCGACARPAALHRGRWAGTSRRQFRASIVLGCGARQGKGLHLAGACRRTSRARPKGRLSGGLELRPRREAELQKKPWWPANAIDPTWRIGGRSGASTKTASSLSVWSSSTRPGPGPT